ncbi:MAG: glyoxalase/bleomycin resistance protein/dioxygenase [Hyphomicrobiales bacterium]|nr:glyoxalase/bleomycin resistance protein/dioxygenase [Hyphomicrobiales bacterium]
MGPTAYLRATGTEHHVLALHEKPQAGLLSVGLAAADTAAVDALYSRAIGFGADVIDAPEALDPLAGGGYGFSFRTPDGIVQKISSGVETHRDRINDRKRPSKLSHVVTRAADFPKLRSFYCDLLAFKLSDATDGIDFLRCSRDHHSVALARADGAGMHHMAFEMPDLDSLMYASGHMRAKGYELEWGVGRHSGPGNNIFSFFIEPNGFAAEYTTEMEQVDDATYPQRDAQWWRENRPRGGPCAWGMATQRSERLVKARLGKLAADVDGCDAAISHHVA